MNMRKIASLEIHNQKLYIPAVLSFLDSIVSNHQGMDHGRYNRLRYVVGEILENRIEKSYPGSKGILNVDLFLSDSSFEVSVRDKGIPAWSDFSSGDTPDITDTQSLRNYILDLWTDGIGMEKLGKDGQRIYVRMNIINRLTLRKPEPYPETVVLDTNITIKPVTTREDAIEAIRCIYSEYGYSYSYEKLYYIDSFMNMIKSGSLMSFLAVNDHGQTAGHFALAFSDVFKNMPEISTVVTRKEFRGMGLFSKFMDYCMEIGKKQGFRAFMGQPVAFHPMSQKAFIKSGFTATSVLLSYIGSDIESEYNKNNQRLDLFASVKILDKDAKSTVYPPALISGLIDKIYSKLGWKYEILSDSKMSESSEIKVDNVPQLRTCKIVVTECGDDFKFFLQDTVKDSLKRKNEMIELMISLNTPTCSPCFDIAKECGFSFSGVIPGGENCDWIIMQLLIGEDFDCDHLVTVGDFEELKNDVVKLNN